MCGVKVAVFDVTGGGDLSISTLQGCLTILCTPVQSRLPRTFNLDKVGINMRRLLEKHRKGELSGVSADEGEMYHPSRDK